MHAKLPREITKSWREPHSNWIDNYVAAVCNCAILKGLVPLSWRPNSHTTKARLHWGCAKCCHVRRGVSTYASGS